MRANFKPIVTGFEKNNGNVGETFKCPLQNTPGSGERWRLSSLFMKLTVRAIPKVYLNVQTAYGHLSEIIFEIDEQIIKLEKKITELKGKITHLEAKITAEKERATNLERVELGYKHALEYLALEANTTAREIRKGELEGQLYQAVQERLNTTAEIRDIEAEISAVKGEIAGVEAEIRACKTVEYERRRELAELGLPEVIQIYNALKYLTVPARLINEQTGEIIWVGTIKLAEKPVGNLVTNISESEIEGKIHANLRSYYYTSVEYTAEQLENINVTISDKEHLVLEISINATAQNPTQGNGVETGHFIAGNSLEILATENTAGYAREVKAE